MNTDRKHAQQLLSHLAADQIAAIAQSCEWLRHNKPLPYADVLADFELSMADFERMGQTPLPGESKGSGS